MADDSNDETLQTESTPNPRPSLRQPSTFTPPSERFTLGEELGRGGMGQVIAARDVSLRRGVAIKKVLSTNEVDLERFEREVRITAELEHPSIVPIHDLGIDDAGRPFYVMRQIRGEPLSSRIATLATLRARLALLPNFLSVIDAAAFAHARGIIHRDIKPANILLGAFGETLLIDWGLARRLDEVETVIPTAADSLPAQLTVAGYVYGTPGYMAPEQARGEPADTRADVFALGATLFHILVGRGPYDGMSAAQRTEAAIEETPPPLELLPDDAPLRAIVTKAMAIDPAQRYATAGELAADVRAFLEGQLVGAHRYTLGERARRFVRRHRAVLTVAVLAIVAGAIALVRLIGERNDTRVAEARAELSDKAAQERDDRIIVEQASLLADVEPARAIAKLRHLRVDSSYFRRGRDIAAKAAARGVAHGDHLHVTPITGLGLSPDGKHLASVDLGGRVVVRAVADNRTVVQRDLKVAVSRAQWIDNRRFVINAGKGVSIVDVVSQQIEPLAGPRHDSPIIPIDPDHVRFVDAAEDSLIELALSTGERRVVARDVKFVHHSETHMLVSGSSGLRWLLPDREIPLTPQRPLAPSTVAISFDGHRAALALGDEVVEWDDTGREIGRWHVRYALRPFYTSQQFPLYAVTLRNSIVQLGKEAMDVAIERTRIVGSIRTKLGIATVLDTGRVVLADDVRLRNLTLGLDQTVQLAATPTSGILAMGAANGEVRWWNLETFAPPAIPISEGRACLVTDKLAYVISRKDEIYEIDRASGRQRLVGRILGTAMPECGALLDSGVMVFASAIYNGTIDVASGEVRKLTNGPLIGDYHRQSVFLGRTKDLIELPHGRGRGDVVWTATSEIEGLGLAGAWMVVRLRDNTLVRRNTETGDVTPIVSAAGVALPLENGDVLYTTANRLWRWTPHATQLIGTLPHDILSVGGDATTTWLRLQDGTIWRLDHHSTMRLITAVPKLAVSERNAAVFFTQEGLMVLSLETEERIEYALPAPAFSARLSADRRQLATVLSSGQVVVFTDPVPADPDGFKAWLDRATNARIDRQSDVMSWVTD